MVGPWFSCFRPLRSCRCLLFPMILFVIPLSLLIMTDIMLQDWVSSSTSRTTMGTGFIDYDTVRSGLLYEVRLASKYAVNKTFIRIPVTNLTRVTSHHTQRVVIMYDYGPCFWVANGTHVHGRTGGEFVWCSSIMGQVWNTLTSHHVIPSHHHTITPLHQPNGMRYHKANMTPRYTITLYHHTITPTEWNEIP